MDLNIVLFGQAAPGYGAVFLFFSARWAAGVMTILTEVSAVILPEMAAAEL